jgi:hypothetical protein
MPWDPQLLHGRVMNGEDVFKGAVPRAERPAVDQHS